MDKSEGKVIKSLRRGAINWEPDFPEGEDDRSMMLHRQALKDEWKKRSRDPEKIKLRMAITYADRRRMINSKKPLGEIFAEYPSLFCHQEVGTMHVR